MIHAAPAVDTVAAAAYRTLTAAVTRCAKVLRTALIVKSIAGRRLVVMETAIQMRTSAAVRPIAVRRLPLKRIATMGSITTAMIL